MITRPDWLRRKNVVVGVLIAFGILLLVLLGDSTHTKLLGRERQTQPWSEVARASANAENFADRDRAWRNYEATVPRVESGAATIAGQRSTQ